MNAEALMPVTVKTFASSGEAAAALSSDRGARYLGGGTLVMRALNEGDISISTVVRATDPGAAADRRRPARASRSAPASLSQEFWPNAILPSCTRPPVRSAARRCATWARWAAICSRPAPMAISPSRCWRWTRPCPCRAGLAPATCRSRNSCNPANARAARWCWPISCQTAGQRRRLPLSQDRPDQAEGRLGASRWRRICRSAAAAYRGAHRTRLDGADADSRKGRRARAGGAFARRCGDQRRRCGRNRRRLARRQCPRQRLVSPRGRRRPSAPPAVRPE